jgi:hypothetical protein
MRVLTHERGRLAATEHFIESKLDDCWMSIECRRAASAKRALNRAGNHAGLSMARRSKETPERGPLAYSRCVLSGTSCLGDIRLPWDRKSVRCGNA